jgi:hypothetical protein
MWDRQREVSRMGLLRFAQKNTKRERDQLFNDRQEQQQRRSDFKDSQGV